MLTDRFGHMLVIAPLIAALSSVFGIYLSYWLDASSGGLVVLVQGAVFAIVALTSPRHGLLTRLIAARRRERRNRKTSLLAAMTS